MRIETGALRKLANAAVGLAHVGADALVGPAERAPQTLAMSARLALLAARTRRPSLRDSPQTTQSFLERLN